MKKLISLLLLAISLIFGACAPPSSPPSDGGSVEKPAGPGGDRMQPYDPSNGRYK